MILSNKFLSTQQKFKTLIILILLIFASIMLKRRNYYDIEVSIILTTGSDYISLILGGKA